MPKVNGSKPRFVVNRLECGTLVMSDGSRQSPPDETDGLAREDETPYSERNSCRLHDPGRWFQFSKDLLHILTTDQALMLAAMINTWSRVNAKERYREKDWFYYRIDDVELELLFNHDKQQRILKVLRRKRIIQYKRRGTPAKRWFFIDFDRVEELIAKTKRRKSALSQ